ncbi:MAG: hypothetical protein BGN88_02665 [Clostridiales bacterium 43-6]|nr:MAG: hypothetical protein BGN88_02665 [Clostridiales bacterium 43-6]
MSENIVIISDFHLGSGNDKGVYGTAPNDQLIDHIGIDKLHILKRALEKRYRNDKIDLLVFLGDYATGRDSREEKQKSYSEFLTFLEDLESVTDIFRYPDHIQDHIIVLPGNHDIQRMQQDVLKDFKFSFSKYINPFRKSSGGVCRLGAPVFVYDDLKMLVACVSTVNHSSTVVTEIPKVIELVENIKNGDAKSKEDALSYLRSQQVKDIPTVDFKTHDNFVQICNEINEADEYKEYRKIVVSHHPLISGIEHSLALKEYHNTIGGFKLLEAALNYGYNYFLHGHIHDFSCIELIDHSRDQSIPAFHVGVPDFIISSREEEPKIVELNLTDDNKDTIRLLRIDAITQGFKEDKFIMPNGTLGDNGLAAGDFTLVDYEIEQLIKDSVIMKNADSSRIEAASYDCALSPCYKRASSSYMWEDALLEPETEGAACIILQPNETVLIYTEEEFDVPQDMLLHASPISSWARKGLRVEISHFVDPGFRGVFCFPVTNITDHELSINSYDPIMSIEFVRL